MRKIVDWPVIIAMFTALYINLTHFPQQRQVVRGPLIKLEVEK